MNINKELENRGYEIVTGLEQYEEYVRLLTKDGKYVSFDYDENGLIVDLELVINNDFGHEGSIKFNSVSEHADFIELRFDEIWEWLSQ